MFETELYDQGLAVGTIELAQKPEAGQVLATGAGFEVRILSVEDMDGWYTAEVEYVV